jgi:toxin ParE1/3/4
VKVTFTPLAERQISHLYEYVAVRASESRADSFVRRIVDYCMNFSTFPERGVKRDDIFPGLRTVGFERRITVAFIVTADGVVVEGIFYGGQDFESVLRQ